MEWQIPSEPLRSFNSPCSLIPCFGKILLLELQLSRQIEQPIFFFSSEITSSRKVR